MTTSLWNLSLMSLWFNISQFRRGFSPESCHVSRIFSYTNLPSLIFFCLFAFWKFNSHYNISQHHDRCKKITCVSASGIIRKICKTKNCKEIFRRKYKKQCNQVDIISLFISVHTKNVSNGNRVPIQPSHGETSLRIEQRHHGGFRWYGRYWLMKFSGKFWRFHEFLWEVGNIYETLHHGPLHELK